MTNPIRDYFHLLGVGGSARGACQSTIADPTIPFDNEFYLLGLDESESDQQIAQQAKAAAARWSNEVDRRGQANQNRRLDILLRDKINQVVGRFDGHADLVRQHREELHRLRERWLKDFAKALCDSGRWTAKEGADMLETIASRIGVAPGRLQKAVSDAVQTAGLWTSGGTQAPLPPPEMWLKDFANSLCNSGRWTATQGADMLETIASTIGVAPGDLQKTVSDAVKSAGAWCAPAHPLPPPVVPNVVVDSFSVGSLTIPLWTLIPALGLALGLINGWAGLTFGFFFLILAWGRANAERKIVGSAPTRSLRWGVINAAVASLPLLVLLAFPPAAVGPEAKWAGEWETDWGKMTLVVNSSRVTGQYASRTGEGRVDLKVSNERQLDGSWCRSACTPPNDTGHLRLILDESRQAFNGWYTYGLDTEIKQREDSETQLIGRRMIQK